MAVQFESRADEILQQLEDGVSSALSAAGQSAVAAVRQQMLTGYAHPVYETGALLESIAFTTEGHTLHVGSTLPYAPPVHDGTVRQPGRPYLADGMLHSAGDMADAAAAALSDAFS